MTEQAGEVPTNDVDDQDMLISQRDGLVFIWCSCELIIHVWDTGTHSELPELGNYFVMGASEWTRDEFERLIDGWLQTRLSTRTMPSP